MILKELPIGTCYNWEYEDPELNSRPPTVSMIVFMHGSTYSLGMISARPDEGHTKVHISTWRGDNKVIVLPASEFIDD